MNNLFSTLAALILTTGLSTAQVAVPDNVDFRNFFKTPGDSLTFDRPVFFAQYPDQDSLYIVLEQPGRIVTVGWNGTAWAKIHTADITVMGGSGTGYYEERGLLGFAFHPDFASFPKYYVYYIADSPRRAVIAERVATVTPFRPTTTDTERVLLEVTEPYDNHNGGTIAFGPDGYLYIGLGDGGDGGDPGNRAQNKDVLLGKFLRIDVNAQDPGKEYAVPADNPFVDTVNASPEVWAYGMRNPWRWTFHPATGQLWAADVGQSAREEVTLVPKGGNLGWRIWEGESCHAGSSQCNASSGTIPPLFDYVTGNNWGRSISGGAFFLGDTTAGFHNTYIFGDYISNRVWAIRTPSGEVSPGATLDEDPTQIGTVNNVVSVERDSRGRLFAVSLSSTSGNGIASNQGRVFVLESPDMTLAEEPVVVRPDRALREAARPITRADFLRDPGSYEVRGLDGRALRGDVTGTVWIREKGSAHPPQLITILR